MEHVNHYYSLAKRPLGMSKKEDFKREEAKVTELSDGEILVKTNYISLDPTNRIWMSDIDQYIPPMQIGEVVRALGVGTVVTSKHKDYSPGDLVSGLLGWQTFPVLSGDHVTKLPPLPGVPKSIFLGSLGMTGTTAYFGLLDIATPEEGHTLVVSAAAGAVGSIVCQIGKIKGMKVIGIAGTPEKCEMLSNDFGVDGTINYKTDDVPQRLDILCPEGIDVYFENVGGKLLDMILPRMKIGGCIPLCGLIDSYNATKPVPGPYQFSQILMKRLTIKGFIILDYQKRMHEAVTDLAKWYQQGKIIHKETVIEGFDKLPEAINMLFSGANTGKLVLKVAD